MKLSARGLRRRSLVARAALAVTAGVTACLCFGPLFAKHATNAGPADPPIKFKVPTPKPLTVEEELATFKLPPGFKIECVASDPMVQDPIAAAWDADGRMWVLEYRGYMHDIDGAGEDQPICRVSVLEDTDGDGKMDKSTVFLDKLVLARAILPTRNGLLIAEPPELDFYPIKKDGTAGEKQVVATGYGTKGGQPEHMANGLMPALDNWIYNASHPNRYRFQQGKWISSPVPSRGQWGVSQDDAGRLYYNSNSDLGRGDPYPVSYFQRNPYYRPTTAQNVELVKEQYVWPSHPTPGVNRGYEDKELRADGTLQRCTATCGLGIYRGDLFPTEFRDNAFIPEPAGNLMKRMVLVEQAGRIGLENVYEKKDFLTSTDERFRPVNAYTGPDGALYVVDLYRGVLQHTAFLTNYLIKNIKERQLESPIHLGRIWRIVPEGKDAPKPTKIAKDPAGLVEQLGHPNGWVRDMAQRTIIERGGGSAVPALEKTVASSPEPLARLHALWTLEGLNRLDGQVAVQALGDSDPQVRIAAIRLCEPLLIPATIAQAMPGLLKLANDSDPRVQMQVALTLSAISDPGAEAAVANLLTASNADAGYMREAIVSGLRGRELDFLEHVLPRPDWQEKSADREKALSDLASCVLAEHRTAKVKRLLELVAGDKQEWRQGALLKGMAPRVASSKKADKNAPPVKLIYLDAEPTALAQLQKSHLKSIQTYASQVDSRLAWPGKPGVPPPPKVIPLTPAQQEQFDKGKVVFTQICAACHQPSGMGQEGLAPPLVDSEWVLGNDTRIVRIVLQGLQGPISVNGASYRLEMPPVTTLSDEDIANVATYIRREWEHNAAPVSVATVKKVREETKDRAESWTAKELQAVK